MRNVVGNVACFLAGLAGLAAAALGIIAAVGVWRTTRRPRPDPPADPQALGLAFEEVTFRARDGLRL
ncbi:MAG: hypothetical protein H5T59_14620, partial [Anaerolineae bacterium]|nr:hypothetical protein [Anaerolineae bacterium]